MVVKFDETVKKVCKTTVIAYREITCLKANSQQDDCENGPMHFPLA
jgi:hypothetical protein